MISEVLLKAWYRVAPNVPERYADSERIIEVIRQLTSSQTFSLKS